MNKQIAIIIIAVLLSVGFSGCLEEILEKTDSDVPDGKNGFSNDLINETTNHPPSANFAYDNIGYLVTFTDLSIDIDNDSLVYLWDFGDGNTSTEKNPIHTYDCSETNIFDITLTVSDDEFSDTHTEHILFGSHLNIIDYSQMWIRNWSDEEFTKWDGYIMMTIENTGNIPAEILYASIDSQEKENDWSILTGKIRFNFTYTYEEVVDGGDGDGLGSEIVITFISNNTLTLLPRKTITLTSNPDLTYLLHRGDEPFTLGSYKMNIWLFKKIRGKDISHTLYETTIEL